MKKNVLLLLIIGMVFSLTACGKSEEVIAAESKITDIGEVDILSLDKIEAAQSLYDSLDEKSRAKVENYSDLQAARDKYDELLADTVAALINVIGNVSENSLNSIVEAESAYAELTDTQKAKVRNYDVLKSARNTYSALLIENVEKLIDSIKYTGGEPTQELQSEIKAAQNAYDDLDESLKPQVKNYEDLTSIKESASSYFIRQAQDAIDLAIDMDTEYEAAKALYEALTKDQKEKIRNYDTFAENYESYKNKPPIELVSYRLYDYYGYPAFSLKATNVSDKIIKEYNVTAFAYDEDGVPTPLYFGDYAADLNDNHALKIGATTSTNIYWTFYDAVYNEMKQFVVIIKDVEFFDDTIWENSQYQTLRDKYEQQLLAADDENILTKG